METKRYNVGPEHGFKTKTILKLTADQAKQMGLSASDVSDLKTTADDLGTRDRYADAMTSQERMREREATLPTEAVEEELVVEIPGEVALEEPTLEETPEEPVVEEPAAEPTPEPGDKARPKPKR